MMKEWRAWEYLVRRTIIGLERMTKDSEMKWVVTKGNEKPVHHTIEFRRRQAETDVGCR